jgi:methyl-accepting chemotaxis protein
VADVMKEGCVACHNSHPQSPKRDWKVGDVRGLVEVVVPVDQVDRAISRSAMQVIALLVAGFGLLGLVLYVLTERVVSRALGNAAQVMDRVAEGDLGTEIPRGGNDEVGTLFAALHAMVGKLRHTMSQVQRSADSIHTATGEVASGNADLSARTERAASSLQQTSSSMEQLSDNVRQNAHAASQANALAASASAVAERGGEVVTQVVATMDDITTSSKKIADIVGVIDGIAFQTNLLALNAAVEAARAGEQGRGFAIVAGEVRSLAKRSAEAAKEIKALIGTSVDSVDAGSRLVQDAGETMREIVASVQRVSAIIGDITQASSAQNSDIGQISTAVTQLDQMTQQNAALVEQGAAAAESLREQALRLQDVLRTFRLDPACAATDEAAA